MLIATDAGQLTQAGGKGAAALLLFIAQPSKAHPVGVVAIHTQEKIIVERKRDAACQTVLTAEAQQQYDKPTHLLTAA